jgi:histidinol-phosphate aminotransferase
MNKFFKKEILNVKPYRLSSHEAWVEQSEVLKLDWNEATIPNSRNLKNYFIESLENGKLKLNWYPDIDNSKLRFLLSQYVDLPEEYIQYYASSDSIHEYLGTALIDRGDNVLIITPTYDNFRVVMEVNGANIIYFKTEEEDRFQIDFIKLCDVLIEKSPKLVYIGFPNNPTGTQLEISQLEYLISNNNNSLFIIDEAYYEFSGLTSSRLILKYDNIIVSRTFSKAFGIAALRIGYLLASPRFHSLINQVRNAKNISSFAQLGAMYVLERQDDMKKYVHEVNKAKDYLIKELIQIKNLKCLDSYGNFILVKILRDKQNLIKLLRDKKIYIRDFQTEELINYVRITVGTIQQMQQLVMSIKEWDIKS